MIVCVAPPLLLRLELNASSALTPALRWWDVGALDLLDLSLKLTWTFETSIVLL